MNKVTISDIRQILENNCINDNVDLRSKTDEELLEIDMSGDFDFDTLDIEEISDEVQRECGVSETNDKDAREIFRCNPVIRNFMKLFKD